MTNTPASNLKSCPKCGRPEVLDTWEVRNGYTCEGALCDRGVKWNDPNRSEILAQSLGQGAASTVPVEAQDVPLIIIALEGLTLDDVRPESLQRARELSRELDAKESHLAHQLSQNPL